MRESTDISRFKPTRKANRPTLIRIKPNERQKKWNRKLPPTLLAVGRLTTCSLQEFCFSNYVKKIRAVNDTPSQSYGMSLSIWDHKVLPATRHIQLNTARLNPSQTGRPTRFTYLGGMEGWVDLGNLFIPRWFTRAQTVTCPRNNPAMQQIASSTPGRALSG